MATVRAPCFFSSSPSCSYSLYSPYYYGDSSQQSSGYSDSYTQPQSGYNSYGFGGGRQS